MAMSNSVAHSNHATFSIYGRVYNVNTFVHYLMLIDKKVLMLHGRMTTKCQHRFVDAVCIIHTHVLSSYHHERT